MSATLPFFWQFWVVGLVLISLSFLGFATFRIYFPKAEESHDEDDLVWDKTLKEGTFAPPKWWFWLMMSAIFFNIIYMLLYPGFGNYNGLFNLTSATEIADAKVRIDDRYYRKLHQLNSIPIEDLGKNPDAMQLAANIFVDNCAGCHGADAKGQANIFPDLTDNAWQWGNSHTEIINNITNGRTGFMPPWGVPLGEEGVAQLAEFVQNFAANKGKEKYQVAEQKYNTFCIGCHNANGKGNKILGTPSLADDIWLYGGDIDAIKHSISKGRKGVMPAQKERLSELQIKLLSAWILQNADK